MKIRKKIIILFIAFIFVITPIYLISAEAREEQPAEQKKGIQAIGEKTEELFTKTGFGNLLTGGEAELQIVAFAGSILYAIIQFLGIIFLILTIYAGYLWMTAGGNDEQVGKAKKLLTKAIIGLAIILSVFVVYKLIFALFG
jgi:hypothetical protein